jgi:hypothetical protein
MSEDSYKLKVQFYMMIRLQELQTGMLLCCLVYQWSVGIGEHVTVNPLTS